MFLSVADSIFILYYGDSLRIELECFVRWRWELNAVPPFSPYKVPHLIRRKCRCLSFLLPTVSPNLHAVLKVRGINVERRSCSSANKRNMYVQIGRTERNLQIKNSTHGRKHHNICENRRSCEAKHNRPARRGAGELIPSCDCKELYVGYSVTRRLFRGTSIYLSRCVLLPRPILFSFRAKSSKVKQSLAASQPRISSIARTKRRTERYNPLHTPNRFWCFVQRAKSYPPTYPLMPQHYSTYGNTKLISSTVIILLWDRRRDQLCFAKTFCGVNANGKNVSCCSEWFLEHAAAFRCR